MLAMQLKGKGVRNGLDEITDKCEEAQRKYCSQEMLYFFFQKSRSFSMELRINVRLGIINCLYPYKGDYILKSWKSLKLFIKEETLRFLF